MANRVPDAWDDDWEAEADRMPKEDAQEQALSRAERLARHRESQRRLWESADAPHENHFVAANSNVPLATGFKPAMKVLSRKPTPQMVAKRDPVTGIERLALRDDEDEDEKEPEPTPEEIRMRQQRELEEKQRRYEEARAKIFGDTSPASRPSTPRNEVPSTTTGAESRPNHRGRGRGRGGVHRGDSRQQESRQDGQTRRAALGSQGSSSTSGARELYDPNYAPKPGRSSESGSPRPGGSPRPSRTGTPRQDDQVIRAPTGPDGSGRGGFRFARRGGKEG